MADFSMSVLGQRYGSKLKIVLPASARGNLLRLGRSLLQKVARPERVSSAVAMRERRSHQCDFDQVGLCRVARKWGRLLASTQKNWEASLRFKLTGMLQERIILPE